MCLQQLPRSLVDGVAMNELVAKEAKVQPALRVQVCGLLRVVLAKAYETYGQEPGDLDPTLVRRHALGWRLIGRLHRVGLSFFPTCILRRIMNLGFEVGNPGVAEDFVLVRANAKMTA
jgi:hypothetical protein